MKKRTKRILAILGVIAILWTGLTFIVEFTGPEKIAVFGEASEAKEALVVYDPDPIYNLDEQVCQSFAKGLVKKGWNVKVATVAAANKLPEQQFDLYVFCANTYNWAPDWSITKFVKKLGLEGKSVAAITLGSGSTKKSKSVFENMIKDQGANLLDSKTYWLMRPNDESRMEESNIKVALEMANDFGKEIAQRIESISNQVKSLK